MQQKEIKLPLAVSSWDEEEVDALKEVIKGNSFTMGEKVKIFEEEFAKYHNSKFCIMVKLYCKYFKSFVHSKRESETSKNKYSKLV